MAPDELAHTALVLLGHGSTKNDESRAPVYQHAAKLRRRKVFARVLEAFWKIEPRITVVLAGIPEPRVFVVPLFISEGYFIEDAIPRELGLRTDDSDDFPRVQRRGDRTLYYCGPIGTHHSMTDVILARAREVAAKFPFPRAPKPRDTALFIAGHGTDRNENSRKAIEHQVEIIRAQDLYAEVHPAFIEEEPRIGECYDIAQARNLIVVPFFISDGMHSYEDIPVLLGEAKRVVEARLQGGLPTWRNPTERRGKLVWYTPSVGTEAHIADVILERVREAAEWGCAR